jgi:hypothetical protein
MAGKTILYILDIERGVHDNKVDEFKKRLENELDEGVITKKEYNEIMNAFNNRIKKLKEIK